MRPLILRSVASSIIHVESSVLESTILKSGSAVWTNYSRPPLGKGGVKRPGLWYDGVDKVPMKIATRNSDRGPATKIEACKFPHGGCTLDQYRSVENSFGDLWCRFEAREKTSLQSKREGALVGKEDVLPS